MYLPAKLFFLLIAPALSVRQVALSDISGLSCDAMLSLQAIVSLKGYFNDESETL